MDNEDGPLLSEKNEDGPPLFETKETAASRKRAVKILGNRYMSKQNIERRLITRGDTEETAHDTVEWLEDIGAVNDAEYAAMIVRHYLGMGYGLARIRDELYKRGIPRELWDEAIGELEGLDDAAYEFINKKLGGSNDKDELRRATGALQRRGFSYEQARTAVNRYLESLDENSDGFEDY